MQTHDSSKSTSDRRDFLQQVTSVAAGVTALATTAAGADAQGLLPTIQLGKYQLSRLIASSKPSSAPCRAASTR